MVDKGSGAYLGGKVTGAAVGTGIASLAVANAAVGLESKVAIHGAHHAFEYLGGARLAHIQIILRIAGQKGSDLSLRIPLPWKRTWRHISASTKYKSQIEQDIQDGLRAGVFGTPGFFINGIFLSGAQPAAAFEKIIDEELAGMNQTRAQS